MSEIEIDIDEKEYFAICDIFPDEIILIASYWSGSLPHKTVQGMYIEMEYYGDHVTSSGKQLRFLKIYLIDKSGCRNLIYDNYPCYVCRFSSDWKNFALAYDGGVKSSASIELIV